MYFVFKEITPYILQKKGLRSTDHTHFGEFCLRNAAVIVAKLYLELYVAIPRRLRTSDTFVGCDAFFNVLYRLGSDLQPSIPSRRSDRRIVTCH